MSGGWMGDKAGRWAVLDCPAKESGSNLRGNEEP